MSNPRLRQVILFLIVIILVVVFAYLNYTKLFPSTNNSLINGNPNTVSDVPIVVEDQWDTYVNYDYRYIVVYPPKVDVENIKLQDYLNDQSKGTGRHTDNICVKFQLPNSWLQIYVNPKDPNINDFCGEYVFRSDEDLSRKQIQIGDKSYAIQVTEKGLHFLTIPNGDIELKVEYSSESESELKIIERIISEIELL